MIHHYIFRAVFLCAALCLTFVFSWGCGGSGSVAEEASPGADPVVTDDPVDSHPYGWQNPDAHGDWVLENGVEGCYSCHRRESDGTEEEPACTSCHSDYPHETGWGDGVNHGVYVSDNGYDNCATRCHGADLQGGTSGISCNSCHTVFPHIPGWTDAENHGAYIIANGTDDCATECHGADLGGGNSGVACTSCHANYPHTDANWVDAGRNAVHSNTFIQMIADGNATACQECHSANYNRDFDGTSCLTCHPDGVTHTSTWSATDHGTYYSERYDSISAATDCMNCHGSPVPFTDADTITAFDCGSCHDNGAGTSTQTKVALETQSDCYGCHWSYPHMSYDLPGSIPGTGIREWQNPTADNFHPAPDPAFTMGHLWYLLRNPLLVDDADIRPWGGMRIGHADHPAAVGNTCGGATANQCHFNGNRSVPHADLDSRLCAQYCH